MSEPDYFAMKSERDQFKADLREAVALLEGHLKWSSELGKVKGDDTAGFLIAYQELDKVIAQSRAFVAAHTPV